MNKCPLPALLLAALLLQPVALWAEAPQPPTAETAATVSVDQLRELAARAASAGNFSAALDYTRQVEDRYADDELLHRSTLTFQEKARGTEDLSLVIPLNKLANLYMRQGRYAEAEQLFRRKLALVEKAGGNGQPRVMAESLSDLAWSYREQGRYADAEPLYRRALAIFEKVLGPEHPNVAASLVSLALLFQIQGRTADAEPLIRRSLAIYEKALGPEHPYMATSLNNLAGLYNAQGRYADAEPLNRRALAIFEKALGPEHPDVAMGLNNLAELYRVQGRYADAEPLCRRALAIFEKVLGPEHPKVAASLGNLALLFQMQGRTADAEPLIRRSLAIYEKALGPEHPDVAKRLHNLAELYESQGRYADAEPLNRRALAIFEKALGPEHPDVATSLISLALLFQMQGRTADAEPLNRRSLAIKEKALGPEHPGVATGLNNLAGLYEAQGRYADAEPLYRRALAIKEKAFGPEHPGVATGLNNLAELYRVQGRYADAEPLHRRALAINEKALGPEHPDVAGSLNNLALLYHKQGRTTDAEPLVRRAYRIALTTGEPRLAWTVQGNLSASYAKSAPDLAIFYGKQAVNTLQSVRSHLKATDTTTQKAFLGTVEKNYHRLIGLLIDAGRLAEAQQVLAMLKEDEYHDFIRRDAGEDPRATRATFTSREITSDAKLQTAGLRLTKVGVEARKLRDKKEQGALSAAESDRLAALEAELDAAGLAFNQTLNELQAVFARVNDTARRDESLRKLAEYNLTGDIAELGPDVVLLQYVVLPETTHILLTTGHTRLARKVTISEQQINRKVQTLLAALRTVDDDPRPAARVLYDHLIAPVADDLEAIGAHKLMVALDGTLRYVPFTALYDGERYLAQRYAVALYTDAARGRLKDKPRVGWKVAGHGVTQAWGAQGALPEVHHEMAAIVKQPGSAGVLPGVVKLDQSFTAQSFKESLRERFPVVHIASHFKFSPGNESQSSLLLGDGSQLSLEAIRNGYSFAGVELITLSACETAVGGGADANGREIEGFGVLAQNQGAKGVIATLWSVDDQSTALLMREFYHRHEQFRLSKAEALQQAQLALLSGAVVRTPDAAKRASERKLIKGAKEFTPDPSAPFAHPYYWAPFILMGNWL